MKNSAEPQKDQQQPAANAIYTLQAPVQQFTSKINSSAHAYAQSTPHNALFCAAVAGRGVLVAAITIAKLVLGRHKGESVVIKDKTNYRINSEYIKQLIKQA